MAHRGIPSYYLYKHFHSMKLTLIRYRKLSKLRIHLVYRRVFDVKLWRYVINNLVMVYFWLCIHSKFRKRWRQLILVYFLCCSPMTTEYSNPKIKTKLRLKIYWMIVRIKQDSLNNKQMLYNSTTWEGVEYIIKNVFYSLDHLLSWIKLNWNLNK